MNLNIRATFECSRAAFEFGVMVCIFPPNLRWYCEILALRPYYGDAMPKGHRQVYSKYFMVTRGKYEEKIYPVYALLFLF